MKKLSIPLPKHWGALHKAEIIPIEPDPDYTGVGSEMTLFQSTLCSNNRHHEKSLYPIRSIILLNIGIRSNYQRKNYR